MRIMNSLRCALVLALLLPALARAEPGGNSGSDGAAAAAMEFAVGTDGETYQTSTNVLVHIPWDLHNATGYDHVAAEFGFKKYSGSIAEYVYYVTDDMCNPLDVTENRGFPNHTRGFQPPFILVTDEQTGCAAVTQARHAQQAGASALVITHEHCHCGNSNCTETYKDDNCTKAEALMSLTDDGSGSDVSIPTFLVFKNLGEPVKDRLQENHPMLMEVQWGLPVQVESKAKRLDIKYHLWTTAHDPLVDLETYQNLYTVEKALRGYADFEPRYAILDGRKWQCHSDPAIKDGRCDDLCTNQNKFCTPHFQDLSGHGVLRETQRRICLWHEYGQNADNRDVWWKYVLYHKEYCSEVHQVNNEECLKKAEEHAGVDTKQLVDCVEDHLGTKDKEEEKNDDFQEMVNAQKRSGIVAVPGYTVNHAVLEHTSTYSLFQDICGRYWITNGVATPEVCETCGACPNIIGCLREGKCVAFSHHDGKKGNIDPAPAPDQKKTSTKKKKSHHGWRFFWFLVFCSIIGGVWYYYKQREEHGDYHQRPNPFDGYFQLSSGQR